MIRYETPDHNGDTRRDINERFGQGHKTPSTKPPKMFRWFWEWFWEISAVRRHGDNGPDAITYGAIFEWAKATGTLITMRDIAILRQMDDAFISALNSEHKDQRERRENEKRM